MVLHVMDDFHVHFFVHEHRKPKENQKQSVELREESGEHGVRY